MDAIKITRGGTRRSQRAGRTEPGGRGWGRKAGRCCAAAGAVQGGGEGWRRGTGRRRRRQGKRRGRSGPGWRPQPSHPGGLQFRLRTAQQGGSAVRVRPRRAAAPRSPEGPAASASAPAPARTGSSDPGEQKRDSGEGGGGEASPPPRALETRRWWSKPLGTLLLPPEQSFRRREVIPGQRPKCHPAPINSEQPVHECRRKNSLQICGFSICLHRVEFCLLSSHVMSSNSYFTPALDTV